MLSLFKEQPPAFQMIFMLEIWERFGFYTMQGILVLFFVRFVGLSDDQAYFTFGAFSALVYGLVSFGGYIGDKILGTKRTIVLGLITLALGYLSLSFVHKEQVYYALGIICVGNGLFKANPSNLLAKCYKENDPRLHNGFTLYYMAINLGSTFALFMGPTLASRYGYSYAFFASFTGLMLGLANYWVRKNQIAEVNTFADQKKVPFWLWLIILAGIGCIVFAIAFLLRHPEIARMLVWGITLLIVGVYFFYMLREKKASMIRMLIAFILMIEAVIFFTLYQQMPTSLNLFAVNNVIPKLLGIPIDPQSFQALNAIWIIIMSPVIVLIYKKLSKNGMNLSTPYKFAAGMLCCGLSFSLLYFARFFPDNQHMVSSWWLVASYFFQSTGELLVSALGVAMVAELVPVQITGFVMGMWFLTSSIAGFIGASVASLTVLPKNINSTAESLILYSQIFAYIGLITLGVGILMWLSASHLNRYIYSEVKSKS